MHANSAAPPALRVRLDKWLWAARFFKTRNLAKQAIEGGKVHYNGERSKVSREVEVGALLNIRHGWDQWEVEVLGVSDQRGGAPKAQLLYAETAASRARREEEAAARKAGTAGVAFAGERPNKKQRRSLERFKEQFFE